MVILQKRVAGLSRASLERLVLRARKALGLRGAATVLVTSSSAVRALNRRFRGKDEATDVLSFPASPANGSANPASDGDIAISADIAAENAARLGHSAAQEVKILALHGILHLAGFDHEGDNGEMARKEMKLRRALNLPAALIERNKPERTKTERAQPAERSKSRSVLTPRTRRAV